MADPETPKAPEPPAPAETPATPEPKAETTAERFLRQRDEQLARGGGIFERAAKGFLSGFGGEGGGGPGQVPYGTPSQDVTLKGTGDVTYDITRPGPKEELTRLPRIERVPDLKLSFSKITTGLGGEVDKVLQKSQQEVVSAISQTYNVLKDRVFTIQKSITIMDKNVRVIDTRQRKFQGDTQALLESMKAAIERQKVQQQSIDQKFMKIQMPEKKGVGGAAEAGLGGIGDILKEVAKWWAAGKVGLAAVGAAAAAGPLAGAAARAAGMRGAAATSAAIAQAVAKAVPSAVALYLAYKFKVNPVTGALEYFQSPGEYTKKKREQAKENWPDWMFPEYWNKGDPNIMNKARERVNQQKPKWTGQKPTGLGEDIWNMFGGSAKADERPTGEKPTTKTTPDKVSVEKTQVDITAKESILLKGTREVNIKAPKITIEASEIVFRGKVTGLPGQAGPAAATGGGYGPGGIGGMGRAAEQAAWRGYEWPQAAGPRGALGFPQMSAGTRAAFGQMMGAGPTIGGPRGALGFPQMSGGSLAALGQMVSGGGGMGFPPAMGRPPGGLRGGAAVQARVAGVPAMAAYGISPRGGGQSAAAAMASTPSASRMPRMAAYGISPRGGAAPSTFTPTAPGEIAEYLKRQLSEGDAYTRSQAGIEAVRQQIQARPPPVMFGKGAPGIPETPGLFGMIGNIAGALTGGAAAAGAMLGGMFGGGVPGGGVPSFRGAGRVGGGGGAAEAPPPPPSLSTADQATWDRLVSEGRLSGDDPQAKALFDKLKPDQLSQVGVSKTTGADGKPAYVFTTPKGISAEEAKQRIAGRATSGGLFGAIMRAEGTTDEKAKAHGFASAYDVPLGYGQYGKPSKPLTEMTLREAYAFGREIRSRHGSSSALGAFQIVGQTMKNFMEPAGLSWDDKFSPENQQKLAVEIAKVQGPGAWEGFKRHPGELAEAKEWLGRGKDSGQYAPGATGPISAEAIKAEQEAAVKQEIAGRQQKLAGIAGVRPGGTPAAGGYTPVGELTTKGEASEQFRLAGTAKERGLGQVDPKLTDILKKASEEFPLRVSLFSGKRSSGGHGEGVASDVMIYDEAGKKIPNYQSPEAFRIYEAFANKAREIQQRDYPELNNKFVWGGAFAGMEKGGAKGKYGAADLMDFRVGHSPQTAMRAWKWGEGLQPGYEHYAEGDFLGKNRPYTLEEIKGLKLTEAQIAQTERYKQFGTFSGLEEIGARRGEAPEIGVAKAEPGAPTPVDLRIKPGEPQIASADLTYAPETSRTPDATPALPTRKEGEDISIKPGEPGYDVKPVKPALPGGTPRLDAAPKPPPLPEMPAAAPAEPSAADKRRAAGAYPGAKPKDATPAATPPKVPLLTPEQRKDLTPGTVGEGPLKQTPTKPPPKAGEKKESVVKKKDSGDRTSELTKPKETAVKTKESKKAPSEDRPSSGGDRGSTGGGGGSNPDHCHFCDP